MVRRLIAAALGSVALAGCGSSVAAHSQSHTPSTPATTQPAKVAGGRTHAPVHRPPEVPKGRMPHRADEDKGADITGGFVVKATVTITPSHRLSPPVIALPSMPLLELTVKDADGHAHAVALATGHVQVPAGGHALLSVSGLKNGAYDVTVDGHAAGKTTVGSAGGP